VTRTDAAGAIELIDGNTHITSNCKTGFFKISDLTGKLCAIQK
jgi:hypothetical protein